MNGNLEEVERLLGQGADVNATENYGRTALMYAEENDHTDTVNLLREKGAQE